MLEEYSYCSVFATSVALLFVALVYGLVRLRNDTHLKSKDDVEDKFVEFEDNLSPAKPKENKSLIYYATVSTYVDCFTLARTH